MMDLLKQFVEAGGVVLACPVYVHFCLYDIIRLRKSDITQFVRFDKCYLSHEIPTIFKSIADRHPGEGLHVSVHAVKKSGVTKILTRLIGRPGFEGEDPDLWKWLFADLKENENIDTVVREKSRWGWAGRFRVDFELEREPVVVSESIEIDNIITTSTNITTDVTNETDTVEGHDETDIAKDDLADGKTTEDITARDETDLATDDLANGKAADNITAHNKSDPDDDSDDDCDSISTEASTVTSSTTQAEGDLFTLY